MSDYENAIEINGLTKKYDGFTLDAISFTVPRGCIMGFIGQNGVVQPLCMATQQGGAEIMEDKCPTITASAGMSGNNQPVVCYPDEHIVADDLVPPCKCGLVCLMDSIGGQAEFPLISFFSLR